MPSDMHPDQVADLIPSGARVFIQGGVGEPQSIIEALARPGQAFKAVDYIAVSIPGINRFSPHTFHPGACFSSFFLHRDIAPGIDGNLRFHPLHYRDIYRFLQNSSGFDVAIIQVSPPDAQGNCSLGLSVDFVPAVLPISRCIVAEINPQLPAVIGAPSIALNDIDVAVHSEHSLPVSPPSPGGTTEDAIAKQVAGLIDDGSCIQMGIGKLPGSILRRLKSHRQLGLHSGLICDETKSLIDLGVITGENKPIDRKLHVTGIALGSEEFYHWVSSQPQIRFKPVDYTHDQRVISSIDQFVSINSVLEVDLQGQANAERLRGRAISASGGLVDFVRGARASRGGKSILALPASTPDGAHSRIVHRLDSTAITTLCRTDIDYVVTEFGSAALFERDVEARARALVDIAAPNQRDKLWACWEQDQP